jgi:hypothetical protein
MENENQMPQAPGPQTAGIIQLNGVQLATTAIGGQFTEENLPEVADLFIKFCENNNMKITAGKIGFIKVIENDF